MNTTTKKTEKRKQLQFYTMKFKSLRLKEFGYNIEITPREARENGEMIGLFDNQFLRSIRKIKGVSFEMEDLEKLTAERNRLRKKLKNPCNVSPEKLNQQQEQLKQIEEQYSKKQKEIDDLLFVEEYITIVIEHEAHYKYLYENGLIINNKKYIRFSCSAGQARVSTVVFIEEDMSKMLNEIVDNGRNKNVKFSPSKLNAYIGLGSSSTQVVSKPRFCVIPDYETSVKVKVNFVTETSDNEDDFIEEKEIEMPFNRFDGMGLISCEKATEWASELGLDYIPSQWCVRQNYLKGMLCTFPIYQFCKEINNGNYNIKTSYKDSDGNYKVVDLREIDVICSESQFKLWNSYDSLEEYIENCDKNGLEWGVSLYTPKQDKSILNMNYQFLQTLNLDKKDVKKICQQSIDWINGISDDNIYYTLLFLLGENVTQDLMESYLKNSDNYWVKSLIVNHELLGDKYIKNKIYELIRQKIKNFCLGNILVDGNFQVIVSDPYAMMQHTCGLNVTGLLQPREYYSNYWNERKIKLVDSMRSPMTSWSEHLKLPLTTNSEMEKWYRYCQTGVIVNIHGSETLNWAGSDFDYDIIATTSNKQVLDGVYEYELPIVYEAPKPEKIIIKEDDLYKADLFSFGSIIGSITNKSTSAYAILPLFKDGCKEHQVIMNRIRMCTKLQSAQIDKAKIGKDVKGIPKIWINYEKIKKDDADEIKEMKEFNNNLLLDKYPYFFKYLYKNTNSKYKMHIKGYDLTSRQKFGIPLEDLLNKKRKNKAEREYIDQYNKYMPVIDTDCVMNNICKYIESVDFDIKSKIKSSGNLYKCLMSGNTIRNDEMYSLVFNRCQKLIDELRQLTSVGVNGRSNSNKYNSDSKNELDCLLSVFRYDLKNICNNHLELVDYLVEIFYIDKPSFNKNLLWGSFGEEIFENVKNNNKKVVLFPTPDKNGNIKYLNQKYKLKEVFI